MFDRSYQVLVQRPVNEVWDFLMDIHSDQRWVAGVVEGKQTSDGPLGVGTTFQYRMRIMGLPAKSVLRVIAHDAPRFHEVEAHSRPMRMKASYSLKTEGDSTALTMTMSAKWPLPLRVLSPVFRRMLDRQWKGNSVRLKELLDSGATPSDSARD